MTTQELYSKGTPVWVPSEETVWQTATLLEDYRTGSQTLDVRLEDAATRSLKISSEKDLPPLRNPDIFSGHNDLTQLSYLHEPAVLHNLQVRFTQHNSIYTYCGIVLVAINPYQELFIYDQNTMETYRGSAMGELDPHIFAIAEEAYTKMEREDRDQSIIVSGESGAGKTVSAKYAMRYFASVNGSTTETNVEKRVLATNPIMEAIGNAKTTRNDNSSRFGKFIEIDFDKRFTITGAKMRTYLLEKSRVVFQSAQERNYHIFYQLCAAANDLPDLHLGAAEQFRYTNQGGNTEIDGVDDYEDFRTTCDALDLLAFPKGDQDVVFRILASILHLGDIRFFSKDHETCSIEIDDVHLAIFSQLLGINANQLSTWLTRRKLVTGREQMIKPLKLQEAEAGRDAFAKHIYARLFNWVVAHVNKKLIPERQPHHFIGVLDIYGFETFERNSFEQFCINYANEKLQQQFVIHVFKLEQEEYIKEEIEWVMIDFFDNQPCIDLIEGKLGILDLLDEECKVPKGSDQSWVQKMYTTAKEREKSDKAWKYFEKPRFSNESFIVVHFADKVEYDCNGFLDKNRDTMNEEFVNLLRASDYTLVAQLFADTPESAGKTPDKTKVVPQKSGQGQKMNTQSVGSQFEDSLKALMATLTKTTPHYVRCIKPNDEKAAFEFDPKRAIQQLRACGVLETIRISAAGFPSRWTYKDFFLRYRAMCHSKEIDRKNIRKTVEIIVRKLITDPDKYKLGKTMIFFRAGQVAYMEKLRSERRMACGLLIQKSIRGWLARKKFLQLRSIAIKIQTMARGYLARRHYQEMRRTAAATTIQAAIRGFLARRRYAKIRKATVLLQSLARGRAARLRYLSVLRHRKAIVIQKHVRGWLARRKYQKTLRRIVLVQCCIRRHLARKQLKTLKVEARSVEHVKQLNKGLENKIIHLQQKVDELNGELVQRRKLDEEIRELRARAAMVKQLEHELHQKALEAQTIAHQMDDLRKTLTHEQKHAEALNGEISNYKAVLADREAKLGHQAEQHTDALQKLKLENQALHEVSKNRSDVVMREFEERIETLQREVAEEREGRQRVVNDLDRWKQRHANLEDQLRMEGGSRRGHNRSPSDVSTGSVASLDSASTGMLPEIGDDGYSTQRSKNTAGKRGKTDWTLSPDKMRELPGFAGLGDEALDLQSLSGELTSAEEELQNIKIENQTLKHQLQIRPAPDEVISEKLRRLLEENLALRQCARQALDGFEGRLNEEQRIELIQALQNLVELNINGAGTMANVLVEDVSSLDGSSLNQLFYSLREALTIQATETSQLVQGRNQLSNQYTALIKENQCLRTVVNKMAKAESARNGISELVTDTTHVMIQNEHLLKENKDLRRKIRTLEKSLYVYNQQGTTPADRLRTSSHNGYHVNGDDLPVISKKGDFQGILEYPVEQADLLVHAVVSVTPPVATAFTVPGLPAFLLFMAVRYTDHVDNERAVKQLLSATKTEIEAVLKKKKEHVEYFALWLLNGLRLVDLMKQYGGEEKFQKDNTPKMNKHCLKNFDLSVFRERFHDLCLSIYRSLVQLMERDLKDDAAKAIIEYESVVGLKPTGQTLRKWKTKNPAECHHSIHRNLGRFFHLVHEEHALDPAMLRQIFRQLLYCLSAHSVNVLMQSNKLCTFTTGIQIRANVSAIQEWVRNHASVLHLDEVMSGMDAITECAQVLQARKARDDDIDNIIGFCKILSNAQILRLVQNYTPSEDFDRVEPEFVKKMQKRLLERQEPNAPGLPVHTPGSPPVTTYTLNTDYIYPVVFPYTPSSIELDSVQLPAELGLDFVKKI